MRKFREILAGGDKGFTLIELLVVIAVLGILAGITIPRLTGVRAEAVYAAGETGLSSIRTMIELEATQEGSTMSTDVDTIIARYSNNSDVAGVMTQGWTHNTDASTTISYSSGSLSGTIVISNTDVDDDMTLDLSDGSISRTTVSDG